MNFKNLELKRSYISYGKNDIVSGLINPALKITKCYRRSVGFFSASVLENILDGILALTRNKGSLRIIASPKLSEEDIKAIRLGYEIKQQIIEKRINSDFLKVAEELNDKHLSLLTELISIGVIDIKIAATKGIGMYHDKLGILTDSFGNNIVFFGSPNESKAAYIHNYEKIRVVRSWIDSEYDHVADEISEFDSLWNDTNEFVYTLTFNEAAKRSLLKVSNNRKHKKQNDSIELRDYQKEAIKRWKANGYNGFYVMATGTGKTWTAIFSIKELFKINKALVVICAPYKHLIKQWAEDLEKVFPETNIIMVSSENSQWENEINEGIIRRRYEKNTNMIVISTIASFYLERFERLISKSDSDRLLIVDEAHRFTNRPKYLKSKYSYMIGLSATPNNGKNIQKGEELLDFFGGVVFSLTIEEALERKFLVPYHYHPIVVDATEDEENSFNRYTANMASCFRNGVCIDKEKLMINHRSRLRVISMATEKINSIDSIIDEIGEEDHFIVYCGDGKLFDDDQNQLRHIQFIKRKLNEKGYKTSQFTATENMVTRMQLIDSFNKNEISALAAIRCLDEGINIPSIKSALILSSNDDYKEFVQRRGRILRTYENKESASIYDVIVLPSYDSTSFSKIELRRYLEFAKLAINKDVLLPKLYSLLKEYNLNIDEIIINMDLVQEDEINE